MIIKRQPTHNTHLLYFMDAFFSPSFDTVFNLLDQTEDLRLVEEILTVVFPAKIKTSKFLST